LKLYDKLLHVELNTTYNKNFYIYPADIHPNKEIHKQYAEILFDFFVENQDLIYNLSNSVSYNNTYIFYSYNTNENVLNGFFKLYYVDRIKFRLSQLFGQTPATFNII